MHRTDEWRIERNMAYLMRLLIGSCEDAAAHLSEHAEGELAGLNGMRVRLHVRLCARCAAVFARLEATMSALRALASEEPDPRPDLPGVVVERIKREPR